MSVGARPSPHAAADNSEIGIIEERLRSCSKRLHELARYVGTAKQVRQYDADRRKNLLAKYVVRALKDGHSATAAEAIGRATPAYESELAGLAIEYGEAEKMLAKWDAEFASFEAARSLLSMQKESMKILEG